MAYMKNKHTGKRLMAIFVLILFLGSSIAVAIIDRIVQPGNDEQTLPAKVSYSYPSVAQENYMISNGFMIVKYVRPENCSDCDTRVQELTEFVSDKDDAYLVIIAGNQETIELINYRANEIVDLRNDELIEDYCSITFNTYDECALRQI